MRQRPYVVPTRPIGSKARRRASASVRAAAISGALGWAALSPAGASALSTPFPTPRPTPPVTPRPVGPTPTLVPPTILDHYASTTAAAVNIDPFGPGLVGRYEFRLGSQVVTGAGTYVIFTGLSPQTDYTLSVRGIDESGNYSEPATSVVHTAGSADDAPLSVDYRCELPFVGAVPVGVTWHTSLPSSYPAGRDLVAGDLEGAVVPTSAGTVALNAIGLSWDRLSAAAKVNFQGPGQSFTDAFGFGTYIPSSHDYSDGYDPSAEFPFALVHTLPTVRFPALGQTTVSVSDLQLRGYGGPYGEPDSLPLDCAVSPGADTVLQTITSDTGVDPTPTPQPGGTPLPTPQVPTPTPTIIVGLPTLSPGPALTPTPKPLVTPNPTGPPTPTPIPTPRPTPILVGTTPAPTLRPTPTPVAAPPTPLPTPLPTPKQVTMITDGHLVLNYTALWIYARSVPAQITFDADLSSLGLPGVQPPYTFKVTVVAKGAAAAMLDVVGATELDGTANVGLRFEAVNALLDIDAPLQITRRPSTPNASGELVFEFSGSVPLSRFSGPVKVSVLDVDTTLRFYDDAGQPILVDPASTNAPQTDADPLTVQVPFTQDPGQDNLLWGHNIGIPTPSPTPVRTPLPTLTTTPIPTETPLPTPTPKPSPAPVGVTPFPTPKPTASPLPSPIIGLPTPTPRPTPPPSPQPTPIGKPTPLPTPTASPSPTPKQTPLSTPAPTPVVGDDGFIDYAYALAGNATLKTLTKGSLPLSGGITAKLGLPSQTFTGDLTLNPATGNLTALGFLPVVAKVNLVPTEKINGSLKSNQLVANAKVRIKLPSVKTLGVELAGGANCQAKQISAITLKSTQAKFLPLSGGPIAGTFSISDLTGCGFLTGIVSPLTSGSGNAIALNLTPKTL